MSQGNCSGRSCRGFLESNYDGVNSHCQGEHHMPSPVIIMFPWPATADCTLAGSSERRQLEFLLNSTTWSAIQLDQAGKCYMCPNSTSLSHTSSPGIKQVPELPLPLRFLFSPSTSSEVKIMASSAQQPSSLQASLLLQKLSGSKFYFSGICKRWVYGRILQRFPKRISSSRKLCDTHGPTQVAHHQSETPVVLD